MTFKYFTLSEFDCHHCGENHIEEQFVHRLDLLREECGFPFVVTSGYRCPNHPNEAQKDTPGTHAAGIAADIAVSNGYQRRKIVDVALALGFGGIGVDSAFVHVDVRETNPVLWAY